MEKVKNYLFLHFCVLLFSFTSVFSKMASAQLTNGGIRNPRLYIFAFLMLADCFVYAICWQKIIKKFDLNIGYANRSVYLFWSQLWAVVFFGESLTLKNVLGLLIVFAGVVIVSISGQENKE